MAEVRKREARKEYTIDKRKKTSKKNNTKKNVQAKKKNKKKEVEKKSLWVRFRIFCHGVKSEFKKVHWPSRRDMVKYSIATIVFILFCAAFFYLINVLFALIQSVLK